MHPKKCIILIDSREQKPYDFEATGVPLDRIIKRYTLETGDYSLYLLSKDIVTIERKSLADFIGSVIHDNERFYAELKRMSNYKHKCVVVESTFKDLFEHQELFKSNVKPEAIMGFAQSIEIDFGIPVHFIGEREYCSLFVRDYLIKVFKNEKKIFDKRESYLKQKIK